MPLKLTLKPNEKVLIGTAVIANGPGKAEFVVLNRVPVVRQKDIIAEEDANTPSKRLYIAILNMYINPENERQFHPMYFALLRQMIDMTPDERLIDLVIDVSKRIIAGNHYQALKLCRKLIDYEERLTSHE